MVCQTIVHFLIFLSALTLTSCGVTEYFYDNDDSYYELWCSSNPDLGIIEIVLLAKTSGWVGLGFGPNPNMTGADIVIGGLNDTNGATYHKDMHSKDNGILIPDTKTVSDWELIIGFQNEKSTGLIYKRLLKTIDNNQDEDFEIKDEDLYLIWAYGVEDDISYHEAIRGHVKVNLMRGNKEIITTTKRPFPTTDMDSGSGCGLIDIQSPIFLIITSVLNIYLTTLTDT